jgi:hypothetical protein
MHSLVNGFYCLIDMIVPDGSGPPPHRHDFEEMFTLLEGDGEGAITRNQASPAGRASTDEVLSRHWHSGPIIGRG